VGHHAVPRNRDPGRQSCDEEARTRSFASLTLIRFAFIGCN
jgi:hypothetical protein